MAARKFPQHSRHDPTQDRRSKFCRPISLTLTFREHPPKTLAVSC